LSGQPEWQRALSGTSLPVSETRLNACIPSVCVPMLDEVQTESSFAVEMGKIHSKKQKDAQPGVSIVLETTRQTDMGQSTQTSLLHRGRGASHVYLASPSERYDRHKGKADSPYGDAVAFLPFDLNIEHQRSCCFIDPRLTPVPLSHNVLLFPWLAICLGGEYRHHALVRLNPVERLVHFCRQWRYESNHTIRSMYAKGNEASLGPTWGKTNERTDGGVLTMALVTTFNMYRWSCSGGTSGLFFTFSVFKTPTAAQCTSPETKVTRIPLILAKFCICWMNQLRSLWRQVGISGVPGSVLNHSTLWLLAVQWSFRSSSSSASALNLFTNPLNPIVPLRPRATSGLNLDSKADSRNTIRGYAIGIPVAEPEWDRQREEPCQKTRLIGR